MFTELYSKRKICPLFPLSPFLPIQNWFERGLAFLLPSKELLSIKRGRKGDRRRERGQQCCRSRSRPVRIRNILRIWIRIRTEVKNRIRSRIKVKRWKPWKVILEHWRVSKSVKK
jgi:hypothetical protein